MVSLQSCPSDLPGILSFPGVGGQRSPKALCLAASSLPGLDRTGFQEREPCHAACFLQGATSSQQADKCAWTAPVTAKVTEVSHITCQPAILPAPLAGHVLAVSLALARH